MHGEGVNPIAHLLDLVDLRENVLSRPKQRAYLARYGRQDFFEDRTIVELNRATRAISEVVTEENDANQRAENGVGA